MIEAVARPELLVSLSSIGVLALGFAFTKKQRQAIIERDGNHCQATWKHVCNGLLGLPEALRKLQVHHILPQRYCNAVGIPNPDFPENGLTLCKSAHIGASGIHPDIASAHSREDFKRVFEERNEKIKQRQIYWDGSHDRVMSATAIKNTQVAISGGWSFPARRSRSVKKS